VRRHGSRRVRLAVVLLIWLAPAGLALPAMTISTAEGVLRILEPAADLIEGAILERLRDGRSVRLDFELSVLAQPGGPSVTESRESFNVSFDLWEERFAVTHLTKPARSVSHLARKAAEDWCLEHLTVPLGELSRFGRETPFWVRLTYRVPERPATGQDDDPYTLQRLIEVLGRKQRDTQLGKSMEAGPFRLSH
jgi:hypothetical protein